jgi:hypothetical protein
LPGTGRTRSRARDAVRAATAYLRTAPPLPLLAALCVVQLAVAFWIGHSSTHNHFVWYSGGDSTEYWTASWSLAHGQIGQSIVGYGVPVLYAWVPLITGTTLLSGLPVIVMVQLLVLVPLALVLLWAVADLLFGRLYAWAVSLLWVVGPLLMLAGFDANYGREFKDLFLAPHWAGLTNMADLPSLVAVLATAWAALRLLARRTIEDAVLAGLLTGVLIGIKPANGFFLPALVVVLAAVRRARPLLAFGAGFAPALLTLALWKQRGLGNLPVTSYRSVREAAGAHPLVAVTSRYVDFSWSHLHRELHDLSEVFWSVRLLEFLALAGAIAVLRRATVRGAFVVLWFVAFCVVKGSSARAEITTTAYYRFVEPGLPAFVLLAAAIGFLLPRRGRPFEPASTPRPLPGGRRVLAAGAIVLGLVPLVLVLVCSPAATAHYARSNALAQDAPLSDALTAAAQPTPGGVRLTWHPVAGHGAKTNYVVFRSQTGDGCGSPSEGAQICVFDMTQVATTTATSFVDPSARGHSWYRIALAANYADTPGASDLMLLGPATPAVSAGR